MRGNFVLRTSSGTSSLRFACFRCCDSVLPNGRTRDAEEAAPGLQKSCSRVVEFASGFRKDCKGVGLGLPKSYFKVCTELRIKGISKRITKKMCKDFPKKCPRVVKALITQKYLFS